MACYVGARGPQNGEYPAAGAFEVHFQSLSPGQQFAAVGTPNIVKW